MRHIHIAGRALVVLTVATALVSGALILIRTVDAANSHALDFEADSGQCAYITDSSQTGLDITGSMTVEFWMKIETDADNMMPVAKWGSGASAAGNDAWLLRVNGASNNISFFNVDGSGTQGGASVSYTTTAGTWQHVALVFTSGGSPTIEVFKNGVSQGTASGSLNSAAQNSDDPFSIGCYKANESSEEFFDGIIDDARVFNVARTGTEIANDYQTELNGNETGLAGYWKFNNSLADATANGNTLTNIGSPTFVTDIPFGSFTENTTATKPVNESVTSSTVLQNDDHLKLSLAANTTYAIEGALFASSTSGTPDLRIAFTAPAGTVVVLSYLDTAAQGVLLSSGEVSVRIPVPANKPTPIHIKGTIQMGGTSGDVQLQWAQGAANAAATTIMRGSYLRAEHP